MSAAAEQSQGELAPLKVIGRKTSLYTREVDERKDKRYGREVHLLVQFEFANSSDAEAFEDRVRVVHDHDCPKITTLIADAIRDALPAGPDAEHTKWRPHHHSFFQSSKGAYYDWHVHCFVPAEKPRFTLPEDVCFARTGAHELAQELLEVAEHLLFTYPERQAAYARASYAEHVLNVVVGRARERARTETRWEQRLAALRAEFEAELGLQAKAIAWDELTGDDGEPIDPRVIAAAREALPQRMKAEHAPGRHPFAGMSGERKRYVSVEDV